MVASFPGKYGSLTDQPTNAWLYDVSEQLNVVTGCTKIA